MTDVAIVGTINTPAGDFGAVLAPEGLCRLTLPGESLSSTVALARRDCPGAEIVRDDAALRPVAEQLAGYFDGRLREFTLPLAPRGTPFQLVVWQALRRIGYGEVRTYAQVAAAIGRPTAVRAVGAANGANPIAVVIPCHRVIGANGKLVGYGGGLELKHRLLQLEGVALI